MPDKPKQRTERKPQEAIFTVTLRHGLADRHRLPLAEAIKLLNEIKLLITDAGKEVERAHGVPDPTGDFGLEILASSSGNMFGRGSVRATVAMTKNIDFAAETVAHLLATLQDLNRPNKKPPERVSRIEAAVISRLDRLAFLSQATKAEAEFRFSAPHTVIPPGIKHPSKAKFGETAIRRMQEIEQSLTFEERAVTVYGKLYELRDKSRDFSEERTGFWGD
jgi:hypothetical protein